ncbi:DNA repair protein complementing XP-G cells homolog [Scyliorhinus canicula]|uniref:DNA repair protein complementing XP-G cells homolog n=1 Tax=Scyliorhinus canicula TaxID=7830 RepID=UPI0018F424A3|nr:DNA repair protein complementing XP-G cells homolog [Scyliorhinus canicula]
MPNSVENQPPKPTGNIKSINVIDDLAAGDSPGTSVSNLFSCYGTPSFTLSSSSTGRGPWMFPVVRAREVFYNVCSDYGLLNKATIIASTPCPSSDPTPVQDGTSVDCPAHNSSYVDIQVDPPDVTHRGNAEMSTMPVNHEKQLLAWEIDTSDFNIVTSKLKSRTGSLKKQNTKKMKPLEKHNKKNNDSSPYAVLEEMKQRKVLDLRRWYCISRPQYKTSCGISSLVSCWNYLFSTCGTGSLPPITQEEALHILGFHQPYEDIRFGPFTGNATLMRWFRQLNEHFHLRGCSYVLYKPHGKNRTAGETAEGALMKLTRGLQDESMAFIYHCQNHYFCPIGFEATPLKASKAFRGRLPLDEMEFWILIGEPSKKHPAIHCKKWADIVTDLNTQNPEYLDIRNSEKGIQYRKTKKVGGNLHCIIAFQKLNWQKLSTWMMSIGNFRCETRSKVSECKANSAIGLERVLNDHREPSTNDNNDSDGFQQTSEWKQISSPYDYRDGVSPESDTDEESIEVIVNSIMGVKGLWKLLECTGQPINPETLEGKILAVDISIWLNQAVKGARDRHGNAVPNAHLLILLHRLCKLLFYRIRPVIVFDGKTPLLKKQTLANRWQRKELAEKATKKTTDKLLRTILKQHALKNVFGGRSDEVMPSLSQVRRGDTEDIFILPSLVKKEENSSDEEAEKEWEERMNNEKLFQNAFLEDPHSVDIESEDFASLPPEVKHEILTDLKEFTKRRRSLLQTMPQESTDFSQYQLTGLLKRNRFNQHIESVQKEMNKQYCGQIQMECNSEGGFIKDIETRRLVSEDASHYILMKGIQSKSSEDKEVNQQNTSPEKITNSAAAELVSNTGWEQFNDLCSSSPLTASSSAAQSDNAAAPASPRTMLAIQAAMLESSSDEEMEFGRDSNLFPIACGSTSHSVNVAAKNLNLSPGTHHAIQQALKDNELTDNVKKDSRNEYDSIRNQRASIYSSNYEDGEVFDGENQFLKIPFNQQTTPKKPTILETVQSCKMQEVFPLGDQIPGALKEHEDREKMHSENDGEMILNSRNCVHPPETANLAENSNTNRKAISNMDHPSSSGVSRGIQHVGSVKVTPQTQTKGELGVKSFISSAKGKPGSAEETDHREMCTRNEDGSDSEGSFIEVVIDTSKVDPHNELFPPDIFTRLTPVIESTSTPSGNAQVTSEIIQGATEKQTEAFIHDSLEEAVQVRTKVEVDQHNQTSVEDATTDDWNDLDLGEIEDLENNLSIEQSGLQSQKQQQERIAATVTGQMYLDSQELLRLFGIPYIVAPTEAEAQCAYLDLTDQTSGTITDDSDIWLFGARHVYKNFFTQDKYVEYYQYIHLHNQLGLDRTKLINLAYFLGSDYTEGIPGVGYVTAMELLNEFLGPGLEPLIHIRDWWTEAQKNKKLRDNPSDTKVKKKLRHLDIYPGFPNPAVAEEYLKPAVDVSTVSLSWGRPDLDEIREFCENRFGWTRKKTDEILLPVMKQLNAHQSQLRIDSFFRMEQHEKQAIKSQRLRRAVTCMLRKEQEALTETQETTEIIEAATNSAIEEKGREVASTIQGRSNNSQIQHRKRKKTQKPPEQTSGGGFFGPIHLSKMSEDSAVDESEIKPERYSKVMSLNRKTPEKQRKDGRDETKDITTNVSSSSSDESGDNVLVTARSVFEKRGKVKGLKTKQRKKMSN